MENVIGIVSKNGKEVELKFKDLIGDICSTKSPLAVSQQILLPGVFSDEELRIGSEKLNEMINILSAGNIIMARKKDVKKEEIINAMERVGELNIIKKHMINLLFIQGIVAHVDGKGVHIPAESIVDLQEIDKQWLCDMADFCITLDESEKKYVGEYIDRAAVCLVYMRKEEQTRSEEEDGPEGEGK
jgi:hypothetical protein